MSRALVIPEQKIASRSYLIRDQKVMLDEDLAELYGVLTRQLNQAAKRNHERFPADFAFQLTARELAGLKSQIVTSNSRGGRRKPTRVFTEHGILMLSSVLNSPRAIQINIHIMRVFAKMNRLLMSDREVLRKLDRLERVAHDHDGTLQDLFSMVKQLMEKKAAPRKRIGFKTADAV